MDAVAAEAVRNGLARAAANRLVAAHLEGAGAMARARGEENLRALLDHYAAGPTITGQGLKILEAADAFGPWGKALARVYARLRGIGSP
jgi:pyrroline-5-carboxylate reductase